MRTEIVETSIGQRLATVKSLGKLPAKKDDSLVNTFVAASQLLKAKKAASKPAVKDQLTLFK